MVSWPQRAVDSLAVRSRLNAFTGDKSVADELDGIAVANDLYNTYRMTVVSELTHSCAAMTVTRGADGTPVIRAHSATTCAMLWDWDRHRIPAITSVEWGGQGSQCVMALQRLVGAIPDGVWGWETSTKVQEHLIAKGYSCCDCGADGYFGNDSVRALQRCLNDGKL